MSSYAHELRSQPAHWMRAAARAETVAAALPRAGSRTVVAGCGTSYYIGAAYAVLRERAGHGETDAFPASQAPRRDGYESALAISRSGTTSEVVEWIDNLPASTRRYGVVGVPDSPIACALPVPVDLSDADEKALVQTRFATSTLALLRASLGHDLGPVAAQAATALAQGAPVAGGRFAHFVFLGEGWAAWIAQEAALKMRETSGVWTEAYPAPEYRHGPVSAAGPDTLVWAVGAVGADVVEHARRTGVTVLGGDDDPMSELVRVHLQAEVEAARRGRDVDRPPFLSRSVVLTG